MCTTAQENNISQKEDCDFWDGASGTTARHRGLLCGVRARQAGEKNGSTDHGGCWDRCRGRGVGERMFQRYVSCLAFEADRPAL